MNMENMSTHYFQEILQYCQSHDRFYSDRGCFTSILNPKHYGCYKNKETIMYKNQLRDRLILQWMKMNQSKGLLYQSICIKPIIQIIGGYADWYDIYWPPDLHQLMKNKMIQTNWILRRILTLLFCCCDCVMIKMSVFF